jgi:MFS family permease
MSRRALEKYLGGAAAARAGDEMSGPALLLLGFAVTGRPSAGSELLASLTIAAAAGGPLFGALLDRSRRPDRLLAATLAAYAIGIIALASAVGRLPILVVVLIALTAGLFNPAVAGGWTAQLPRLVTGSELDRGSALDALTYSAASLTGPALAALLAAWFGARVAVVVAAGLVALAAPAALSLSRYPPPPRTGKVPAPHRQVAAGFAAILTRRKLRRATVTSVISFVGIGMFVVCCPVLGAHRLGGSDHGALLITAMAAASLTANAILARRRRRGEPDVRILISTLMLGVGLAAAAIAPGWLTLAAVAIGGAGEGPQLTALFAVRHRESPEHMRGQIYTTAASLKIAGTAGQPFGHRLPVRRGRRRAMRCGRVPAHQRAPGGPGVPPAGAEPVRKDGSHGPFGKMTYACRHAMRAECCMVAGRLGRSYSAFVSRPSGMGGLFRAPDGPDPRGT